MKDLFVSKQATMSHEWCLAKEWQPSSTAVFLHRFECSDVSLNRVDSRIFIMLKRAMHIYMGHAVRR